MKNKSKTYILKAIFYLLTFATLSTQGQERVKGEVKDRNGKPVVAARVEIGITKFPVLTNKNGLFEIDNPVTDSIYLFKKGFKPYKESYIKGKNITVQLMEEDRYDQLISLPWLTTVNKLYYPGAIGTTNGDEIARFRNNNSSNALAGTLAGLITQQGSDEPGYDGSSLWVRGISSYNNGSTSTYVDNVPVTFSQLDPLEIASFSILKDATANASYGIYGANKTLFVTTKRGEAFNNKINFYAQFGVVNPTGKQNYLGAQQYMQLYNEAAVNDGLPVRFTATQIDAYNNPDRNLDRYPDVDWYDEVIKNNALQQKYNLTFSGGNNQVRYFILLGYASQGGLFKHADFNEEKYQFNSNASFYRYNFRSNIDFNITKNLIGSVDIGGRLENQFSPGAGTDGTNGIWNNISKYPPGLFPMLYSDGKIGGNSQFQRNPYGIITQTGYTLNAGRNLLATTKLTQKMDFITAGLSATAAFSYFNTFSNSEGRSMNFATYELQNDGTYAKYGNDASYAARGRSQNQNRLNIFWAKVDYQRTFNTRHELNANVGYNQSVNTTSGDDFPYVTQGFFGRVFYNYGKKYIAEFNAGYNGSENLPKGARYGFFPSLGLAWLVSNESFFKSSAINLLKLRGSYGILGNADFGLGGSGRARYLYLSNYETGSSYQFGTTPVGFGGRRESSLGNPGITWEKNYMANAAVDAAFFNNNLGITVEVFRERRTGILAFPLTLSSIGGFDVKPFNVGEVTNKGIEWDISYRNQIGDLNFELQAIGSFVKNNIVYQAEQIQPYGYLYRTGNAVGTPFGLEALGLFQNQQEINSSPKQSFGRTVPGDLKYKDQNSDGVIDVYDYVKLGKPNMPQFYYGGNINLSIKGFDFKAWLQGAGSRTVDISNIATQGFSNGNKPTDFVLNRWTADNASGADYPRLSLGTNANNLQSSSFWKRNGSYFRIKNVELGYSLPQSLISRVHLSGARIFANAFNVATWSGLPANLDPEFLNAGLGAYPRVKSYTFGINLEF